MKKIICVGFLSTLLILVVVFSGIFNENFGLIRGLRAKHLLETTPKMLEGFKEIGGPAKKRLAEIETKYNTEISNLMDIRDKARNDFFKISKDTRDTSKEGHDIKFTYLDAVYNIVILEHQKNMEMSAVNVERYTKGREVRLSNI